MRKFRFALERVLKVLKAAEDLAGQRVLAASLKVQAESMSVRETQRELEDAIGAQRAWIARKSGKLRASDMAFSYLFLQRVERKKLQAVERLQAAMGERDRRIEEYRECSSRRKAIGILRERQLRKHLQMWAREYQAFLDDTVAARSARGSDDGTERN